MGDSRADLSSSKTLIYLRKTKPRSSAHSGSIPQLSEREDSSDRSEPDTTEADSSSMPTPRDLHHSGTEKKEEKESPVVEYGSGKPVSMASLRRTSMPDVTTGSTNSSLPSSLAAERLAAESTIPQSPEISRMRNRDSALLRNAHHEETSANESHRKRNKEDRSRFRNKLGQIKRVGVNEYNHRIVKMIKDKYHEEMERVDHVDLCDPHVTLLDLRERDDYIRGHIQNAINIPASSLISGIPDDNDASSSEHASRLLLEVHVDSLLRFSIAQGNSHVFIFYYYTKHRMYAFFGFRRMRKLLRRALRIIEKSIVLEPMGSEALEEHRSSSFHVCVAERGFDHLVGEGADYAVSSSYYKPPPAISGGDLSRIGTKREPVRKSQSDLTPPRRDNILGAHIHEIISDFLYFGDAPLYLATLDDLEPPEDPQAQNLFFTRSDVPPWLKCSVLVNGSRTPIDEADEQTYCEYYHIGTSEDPEREFFRLLDRSNSQRKPILVHRSDLGCSLLAAYLVGYRRWSLGAAVLHIRRCLYPHPASFDIQTLCNVLLFERSFLSYSPSVKLQSLVLHQLGEEDLDVSIAFYESGNTALLQYRGKASHFFKYVNSNKRSKAMKVLQSSPDLIYARDGPSDNTALHLICDGQHSVKDKVAVKLFQSLCEGHCVNLRNIDGMTPLHLAANNGAEGIIRLLVEHQASVTHINHRNGKFPLHYAARANCAPATMELLITPEILNVQDSQGLTALHSATINGNKHVMNLLLSKGAIVQANINGQTPMHLAKQDPKLLQLLMEDARPGEVMYGPFGSFAPCRQGDVGDFLIDGEDAFTAMADAMTKAKHSIYITGWWLTPNYYLKREGTPTEIIASRLDKLLKERADHGVSVYILIWDSPDSIIPIKSSFTKKYLDNLHANINIEHHASSMQQFLAWTHHQKTVVIDETIAFVGGLDVCLHRWDKQSHPLTDRCHVKVTFPGRDYYNPHIVSDNDDKNDESFMEYSSLDRSIHPRMPWHDVTCRVHGEAATDVALNFVQRWNFLIPKRVLPLPSRPPVHSMDGWTGDYCQVVRSIGGWSLNSKVETSVYEAYCNVIETAETFIYIENQFFISPPDSKMRIAEVLLDRIRLAFTRSLPFHVVIVLPIHPEGDLMSDAGLQRIYSWQQKTILWMQDQLKLMTRGTLKSPSDYISFYALRNWDELGGQIVTEMIYVHTKLILTDSHVICGSANINERSMLGDRDSEIAVVIRNPQKAMDLRKRLWAEHLGLETVDELNDSALDDLALWKKTALENTSIYVKLFEDSIPEAEPLTIKQYLAAFAEIQASDILSSTAIFESLQQAIRGHLVLFPVRFLHHELQNTIDLKQATFQQIKEIGGYIMDDLFR